MVLDKRVYEAMRSDLNIKWYHNEIYTMNIFIYIGVVIFISIAVMIAIAHRYIGCIWGIIMIIGFIPIILILVFLSDNVPRKVGLFSSGIVFDWNGKYEYLYWLDVEDYLVPSSPFFAPVIKKKDGSTQFLNLVDKEINAAVNRNLHEYFTGQSTLDSKP